MDSLTSALESSLLTFPLNILLYCIPLLKMEPLSASLRNSLLDHRVCWLCLLSTSAISVFLSISTPSSQVQHQELLPGEPISFPPMTTCGCVHLWPSLRQPEWSLLSKSLCLLPSKSQMSLKPYPQTFQSFLPLQIEVFHLSSRAV